MVKIQYTPSINFIKEEMTINIENTSYGALHLLNNDLKKMLKSCISISFTEIAYQQLLSELTIALEKKLNEEL